MVVKRAAIARSDCCLFFWRPPFRVAFQLRDIEKLSAEETAEALGLAVAAMKSRFLRARLRPQRRLNKYLRRNNPKEPAVFKDERS
jgi:DNA-directed RNA polymerase specialized sigma24 family protein